MNAANLLVAVTTGCSFFIFDGSASGQGTAFRYQGQLADQNNPANGAYDLEFALYDAVTNGNQIGVTLTNTATRVSNGLFGVTLDFGGVFNGQNTWLDISVRTNGGNQFTELGPRQPITPVPYAIMANNASNLLGSLSASQLSGTLAAGQLPGNIVTNGSTGVYLNGIFSGSGSGLAGVFTTNLTSDDSIVSIVLSAAAPTPSTNWTFHAMDYASTNFLTMGGLLNPVQSGPGGYYSPLLSQTGGSGQAGFENANAMSETFGIDGSQFVFGMLGQGRIFSIIVNGVDNFITNGVPSDGNPYWFTVTFATAATRIITINDPYSFYGVYTPVTNGFFTGKTAPHSRMVVLGDSFTEQTYQPGSQAEGLVSQMQLLLPLFEVWALGEGGTGFVNPGVSGGTNFLGRVNDVVNAHPNYVIVYGGINDAGYATGITSTNIIFENATNLLLTLQSRLPAAQIAVIGPQWPRTPSPAGDSNVFNCAILLSNACNTCRVPFVSPVSEPWITGNVAIPNSGNADIYIRAADQTHPTIPAGARFLANEIVVSLSQFWNLSAPVTATAASTIPLTTNSAPTLVPGVGILWNSNSVLYWVTSLHTNYISGP